MENKKNKQFARSKDDILISGVCGGIAEYFNIDSNIVRLIFVIFGIFGAGVLVYIVLWVFLPISTESYKYSSENNSFNNSKIFDMGKDGNVFKVINSKNNSNVLAVLLIVLGVLFLLNNFFHIFYYLDIARIWPIILVIVGAYLIVRKNKK